nr:thioesterase domain-containing protein [Xenorhabdus lircayensis]
MLLFFVHEPSGDPLVYSPIATLLPPELPVYALPALGIHTLPNLPTSIEELAACHIQAIRRVQPHGPYHLTGWSMGGVIAYEIALQLTNCNEEIAFIGMIDSRNPNKQKIPLDDSVDKTQQRIDRIINHLQASIKTTNKKELEELRCLDTVAQVLERCVERQWLPTNITREDLFLRLYTIEALMQLGENYVPSVSWLPIHLYLAEQSLNDDEWLGWRDVIASGSFMIHHIGGTHHTIMQLPLLNQVADSITGFLLPK